MILNSTTMKASTSTPSRAALCWDMGIPAMRSNGSFALQIKYSVRLWFHALLTNSSNCPGDFEDKGSVFKFCIETEVLSCNTIP